MQPRTSKNLSDTFYYLTNLSLFLILLVTYERETYKCSMSKHAYNVDNVQVLFDRLELCDGALAPKLLILVTSEGFTCN